MSSGVIPFDPNRAGGTGKSPRLKIIEPIHWHGIPLPDRRWVVPGLIPVGAVTMLGGDGGLGKSLLALQLAAACALGRPWLGFQPMSCRAIVVACEDCEDELQIRIAAILKHLERDFGDLEDLRLISRVGEDNGLVGVTPYGKSTGKPTPFYTAVLDEAVNFGARLLVLDSLHDLYPANENIRGEVRAFISLLQRIALKIDGAVLLLSHPSLAGLTNGTGQSGSTAWNAAVRSRLYLSRPKNEEDRDGRELQTKKANYGALDRSLKLRWQDGVFVSEAAPRPRGGIVDRLEDDSKVVAGLNSLMDDGVRIPAHGAAKNGLAPSLHAAGYCKHLSHQEIVSAQERLLASGKLVRVEWGPPSKVIVLIRPLDRKYPGEREVKK